MAQDTRFARHPFRALPRSADTADGVVSGPLARDFPGRPDQVSCARAFVADAVAGCPAADELVLMASELATNAVVHSASGDGGTFGVVVYRDEARVRVEVRDDGGENFPLVSPPGRFGESGAGLGLIASLADRWGHDGGPAGRTVWFEVHS
jgi:anti-sigma regulatory factor (Ser/Thr protein kinase)